MFVNIRSLYYNYGIKKMDEDQMKNAVFREKEQNLMIEELGAEALEIARNELYLNMRFLGPALSSLKVVPDGRLHPAGTDGQLLAFGVQEILELFKTDRRRVNRLYMHLLLHCIFGHLFLDPEALMGLACDITVEYILDGLYLPCLHHSKSARRLVTYRELEAALPVVTAQGVLRVLRASLTDPEALEELRQEFTVDDHQLWHKSPSRQRQALQRHWKDVAGKTQAAMEVFSKEAGEDSRSLEDQLAVENRRRYDYRAFLRKFSVLKEEVKVDPDAFDPVFYQYGLELYGNMPLIEPLETREVNRIEDFVVVLDTSMSCKGTLIRGFLEETFSILNEAESFARRVHIHLIQCDDAVRMDTTVTSREELQAYVEHFEIRGYGGTDFRPAFAYVNELLAMGTFHRLKGLIYFTDGYGIFPVKKPVYDTAFVFMKDDYRDVDVPPWAMKVILDPEDVEAVAVR